MDTLQVLTYLVWLVAGITFILALKFLASPKTARTGNLLGAAGMALIGAGLILIDGRIVSALNARFAAKAPMPRGNG